MPHHAEAWLRRALRSNPEAPRVPISDIERAARALGLRYEELREKPPELGDFVQSQMRVLFPLPRVRSLRRWLVRSARAQENPADASSAEAVLAYLRSFDRPDALPARNAVFDLFVLVSLEAARRFDTLERALERLGSEGWPGESRPPAPISTAMVWLDLRVPPVDLLTGLRWLLQGRPAPAPASRASSRQLSLLEPPESFEESDERGLDSAAKEALAESLERRCRTPGLQEEALSLGGSIALHLRGAPGRCAALEALLRFSALSIPEHASAAEQARLDAALAGAEHDPQPLVDYGDYLARALRTQEAVRAYRRARLRVAPAEREAIDERLRAREDRLRRGEVRPYGPRTDPAQLRLGF